MKKLVLILFIWSSFSQAQEHAWVYFKDKPDATSFLAAPHLMLTQRSLDRRTKQGIAVNEQDVPVYPAYVAEVATSTGITLKARSRWLNAIHVLGSQIDINNLLNLEAVDRIEFANKNIGNAFPTSIVPQKKFSKINKLKSVLEYNYGNALNQTTMLGVDEFHKKGYDGKSLEIAVIDAGFSGVNTAGAFSHLLDNDLVNGEILGGYDFVNKRTDFYQPTGTTHGTQVLSTIAAIKENEFVGTAPKASFYLYVTEDESSETPLEESLWVQAAEKADSLGVDIINTSLGYSQFDESKYNYTYSSMDGKTTFITRGAAIAAEKGMIVVNSAGNSGNDAWKYLTAPADAENIITVGAVNPNESITSFSSFGPSADNRIKPETLAQGGAVYVVDENNTVKTSNGTSFSGPIIAGVTACLWQAFPLKTSLEIRQMVIENSEKFLMPTNQEGYGILRIGSLVSEALSVELHSKEKLFYVMQDSSTKTIEIVSKEKDLIAELYSTLGNMLVQKKIIPSDNQICLENYTNGVYYLKVSHLGTSEVQPLIISN